MKINERSAGEVTILELEGNFSGIQEVDEFQQRIQSLLSSKKKKILILFDKVTYLNRPMLDQLIKSHTVCTILGGKMKMAGFSKRLKEASSAMRVLSVIECHEDEHQALASFLIPK